MRSLVVGIVLMCLTVTTVQAGLLDVVNFGNRSYTRSGVLLQQVPLPPIPEGALFVDPIASTRGEGVFREGPNFKYDSTTGGVTVFAPPLLGPEDEFGVRQQYSPQTIKVVGEDYFANTRSIPQVIMYRRSEPEISQLNWQQLPFEEDDPSFEIDESSDYFGLHFSSESINVGVASYRGFTGAEIDFTSLLKPGLGAEFFDAEENNLLPNSIWPYLPGVEGVLPNVYFVVNYGAVNYNFNSEYPDKYSLLAVPQAGSFLHSVPEPSSAMLACCSVVVLLTWRLALRVA